MGDYGSLAYRRRTGQLTTEDYRVERDRNFKLLAESQRRGAEIAQELEEAFVEIEAARETIKKQQEIIDSAFIDLDDYLRGDGQHQSILDAFAALKESR